MVTTDVETMVLTGANGYLGSYVCREALRRGWRVVAMRFRHPRSTILRHPKVEYHECDIGAPISGHGELDESIRRHCPRAIINCAALLGSRDAAENNRVNAEGVGNLIELAKSHGIERFVHVSSVVTMKAKTGPYGKSKILGDEYVKNSDLDFTVFIPAMVLGPESPGLNRVLKNVFRFPGIVPMIGDGSAKQHPVFVEDFARCIVDSILEEKCRKQVYQIAGDTHLSFREFVREILVLRGTRKVLVPVPVWAARMMGWLFTRTQSTPLFTAEHVVGVTQDSILSTDEVRCDLGFEATPFREALSHCLDRIGDDWGSMLRPGPERIVELEEV